MARPLAKCGGERVRSPDCVFIRVEGRVSGVWQVHSFLAYLKHKRGIGAQEGRSRVTQVVTDLGHPDLGAACFLTWLCCQ